MSIADIGRYVLALAYFIAFSSGVYVLARGTVIITLESAERHSPLHRFAVRCYLTQDRCMYFALMTSTMATFLFFMYNLRWAVMGGIPFTDFSANVAGYAPWMILLFLAASALAWHRIGLRDINRWREKARTPRACVRRGDVGKCGII